jgi:16S rRNA processing protein RimM
MRRPRRVGIETQTETTGSPRPGEPVFLAVGFLRRPHGVKGEILMDVLSDYPERLQRNNQVLVGEEHEAYLIRSVRNHSQALLIAFTGIENPEQAGLLRNKPVYVQAAALPELPEGSYYHHQLIGLAVVDNEGQNLGTLSEILETGANEVYVVTPAEGAEILLPVIEGVVLGVDLERKEMRVNPPAWE